MDELYSKLYEQLKESGNQYDFEQIEKAYLFARSCHDGQKRDTGEDYITHPLSVAIIAAEYGLDNDTIVASLLHDVVEDCSIKYITIKKEFGKEIADLVEGVTKLSRIPYVTKEEAQVENLRKMLLAMTEDIRVILIKMADRVHNMRTMEGVNEEKRRAKSLETMEIYAPLAHRLGMQKIKWELEDTAIKYLDPVGYAEIMRSLGEMGERREQFLDSIMKTITAKIDLPAINGQIEGRVKHIYSIYRKMYGQNKSLSEIYDLFAIRIIVDTIGECYNVLGTIHEIYKPIPNRFKDYISTPKPNMYQSLHTTVIGREGKPFEVQIRTWDMHKTAEYGIAAHWKYKDGVSGAVDIDEKLEWIKHLVEIQEESGSEDFMRAFKIDLFGDEVFVFTPKGDVINLPLGATVIDFAYAIHSGVGNAMIGAKIDGKIVQLDHQLENGKIVEILTSNGSKGPSRDWLKIAKTGEAKNKIRQWFKKEKREENIETGREDLARELKRNSINLIAPETQTILEQYYRRNGYNNAEDLYAAIGFGGISLIKVATRVKDEYVKLAKNLTDEVIISEPIVPIPHRMSGRVVVEGLENCLVKFAKCCSPLPGDPILGYITRGFGVSVHKKDCQNIQQILNHPESDKGRFVNVSWQENTVDTTDFSASIVIVAIGRAGILLDVTTILANLKVSIHALNAKENREGVVTINLVVSVRDLPHLEVVMSKIAKIKDVIRVNRE